jgi:hypothetical protein
VLGLKPDVHEAFREVLEVSWQMTDPGLLDLCRLRLAQLNGARAELAGIDAGRLSELERRHESSALGERERAALGFAEQYHVDHRSIDEARDSLARHLSERELVNFVWALHMHDAHTRLLSLLDIEPDLRAGEARRPRRLPARVQAAEEDGDVRDPAFLAAYRRLARTTVRQSLVDDLTSEAVRLHNAQFQGCRY